MKPDTSLSDYSIDRLEAAAQRAEDAWRAGDFAAAFKHYAKAVSERLATRGYGIDAGAQLEAADFVVFERLSDLARLFGLSGEADTLLAVAIAQISAAGNKYWADLLRVKRVDLALGSKQLRAAQSLLEEMSPSIGDVQRINFTSTGLKNWELRCDWPGADEGDRATIFVLLSFVMGRMLAALGQYEQAEAALQNGLNHALQKEAAGRIYRGPQELAKQAVLPLKLALANALLEKGDIQRAATCLNELQKQPCQPSQPAIFVQTLEVEGKLSLFSGNYGAALACFREVLALCEKRGFLLASVAATFNLVHVEILLNQTLEARRHLQEVQATAHANGDFGSVARAEWLLQLASARAQSLADGVPIAQTVTEQWDRRNQQDPTAEDQPGSPLGRSLDESVNPFDLPPPDNYLAFFEERALGFHWLLGRRDFSAGAVCLAQLQATFAATDSFLIKLRLEVLSGLLAYYQLDFEQAEHFLMRAQPELERLGLVPELWQLQRILGWCRLRLGRDERLQEQLTADNSTLLRNMTASLAPEDRAFFLLNKWTIEEEGLALLINQLIRMKTEITAAPWYRRFGLRRRLKLQLEALLQILDRYRDIAAKQANQPSDSTATQESITSGSSSSPRPSLWRRLRQYKWREATISFLVLPDRVLLVRRKLFSLDFGVSPATRLAVRDLVRQWHEIVAKITEEYQRGLGTRPTEQAIASITLERERGLGKRPTARPATEPEAAPLVPELVKEARKRAEQLSVLLQLPSMLESLPRWTRTLTLLPDDCLHGFPFAAITHRGRYLIEHYALAFAYADQPASGPSERTGKVLLVGASLGDSDDWPPLEFVREELDSVEEWAKQRKLTSERLDDARPECAAPDKTTVLAAFPQTAIVHLACHGLFKPDRPAQSGIVLRPAREPEVLSVQELSALDLTNVQHVTLSACWSADHFILPGRWVISLPETLARAGVASVLGCLWLVDDRVGTAFMIQFYRHLNKFSRAEALRRTQLDCLNGKLEVTDAAGAAQPIFWAGYQLYGRSAALNL